MTLRLRAYGCCGLLLLTAASARAQAAAASDEFDAAEALFKLGTDRERGPEPQAKSAWTYGVRLDIAGTAAGGEPRTHLDFEPIMRPRLGTVYDFDTEHLLQPMAARAYPSAHLMLSAEWEAADWLLLRGLLDSGQIRQGSTLDPPLDGITIGGSPALDALKSLDIVRELSVVIGRRVANMEFGRFRTSLADGLVYDGFGAGARARVNLDALAAKSALPLRAELVGVGLSDRLSQATYDPLLALRVEHELSLFETIGVFGAIVWDRNGAMSDVMRSALAERVLASPLALNLLFANDRGHATMGYVGGDAQLSLANGLLLRTAATLGIGQFAVVVGGAFGGQERTTKFDVLSGAANAELRSDLGHGFEGVGYLFALTGDGPPVQGQTYHAFISPAPYWVWTGLFFSGGLNQSLFENRAALGGIHGHGVAGGGPGLTFSERPWLLDVRAIWLQALSAPPVAPWGGSGRSYGLELDGRAELRVLGWLEFGAELDALFAANYFPRQRVAYRALGIVSFAYER